MDKPTVRRSLLSKLRAMVPESRASASRSICEHLTGNAAFQTARTVLAFLPLPVEPDLRPLLETFPDKTWGFPWIMDGEWIRFHHLSSASEAIAGPHGIREPDPMVHPVIPEAEVDLLLVPGLGFDPETHGRIGRGRGYYDRFLSAYRGASRPALIGVAFSCQLTRLVMEAHDVPVHAIVTECGWS